MTIFILPTCNLRRAFLVVDCTITRPQPPDLAGPPEGPEIDVRCAHAWRPTKGPPMMYDAMMRRGAVRRIDWRKMNDWDRNDFEAQILKKSSGGEHGY